MMGTPATLAGLRFGGGATPANQIPATGHPPLGRRLTPVACAAFGLGLLSASGCGPPKISTSVPAAGPAKATAAAAAPRRGATAEPAKAAAAVWSGPQLYVRYCAGCHGENGDGNGPAARFLNPKPRNFREGQFRLVTTMNRVPSDEDLMRVVARGMPGSAMFPLGHLSEVERKELVAHVRRLVRGGLEDRLRREAKEFGEEVDPQELARTIAARTRPGPALELPHDLPDPGPESVARGRALYLEKCATCHGDSGKGDGVQEQRDESGMPIRPRDFTRGIFKGGRDRAQLYARIMLGVPGTPMPESSNFKPAEVGDLINYIQSLSDASTPARVEHRRTRLVVHRAPGRSPTRSLTPLGRPSRRRRSSSARSGGATSPIPSCACRRCTTARRWPSASPGGMRPATRRRSGPRISPIWPPSNCSGGSASPSSAWGGRRARWTSGSGMPPRRPTRSGMPTWTRPIPTWRWISTRSRDRATGRAPIPRSASLGTSSPPGRPAISGPTRPAPSPAAASRPRGSGA